MKVPLKEVNSNDTDRSLGWALLTPGTVNYLLTGTKSFTYLSEVCVTHARTELMVISWLLVCYQHIFTLRVSELLQTSRGPDWDQMWIFSCNSCRNCYRLHTLCLPVQTVTVHQTPTRPDYRKIGYISHHKGSANIYTKTINTYCSGLSCNGDS